MGDDVDACDLRADLRLEGDELLVLQPTRVVPRKGIEHSLELVHRRDRPTRLVISGSTCDEGPEYGRHIAALARAMGVDVVWASDRTGARRGSLRDGCALYSLDDVFAAADLVVYPSLIEGFGRGFLAAVRQRRPIIVNRSPAYDTDIRPYGFRAIEMDGFVSADTVARTRALLDDPEMATEWADHNLELVRRHFSTKALRRELRSVLEATFGGVA